MLSRSLFVLLACLPAVAQADTFGSGENAFEIPFVAVGDAGNAADTTGAPNPAGRVDYWYRIGKYEIPEEAIRKANAASEAAGDPLGITLDERGPEKPATRVSWFEAARFVNWLNEDQGAPAAYKFNAADEFELWQPGDAGYNPANPFRNAAARYFLPSIDEWYKAAFYDPTTGGYFDYPTGSDDPPIPVASGTDPGTAVWNQTTGPADVQLAGGESPWGTVGQGGNVWELDESPHTAGIYEPQGSRGIRGNDWASRSDVGAAQAGRLASLPFRSVGDVGFRIATIPEPSSWVLAIASLFGMKRPRRPRSQYQRVRPSHERLEHRRVLATLTVNTAADSVPDDNDGVLTIREAIAYVNGDETPDTGDLAQINGTPGVPGVVDRIIFADSVFDANGEALIELLFPYAPSSDAGLVIEASVEIEAPVGKRVEVSATVTSRR